MKNWRQTIAGGRGRGQGGRGQGGRGRGRGEDKKISGLSFMTIEYKIKVCENSYLGGKGYTISKTILCKEDLDIIKKELFLIPQTNGPNYGGGEDMNAFPVYRENDKKIYIPRFYGIERYGEPLKSDFTTKIYPSINIPFEKPLRDYQDTIIETYMNNIQNEGVGGILQVPCGRGKCLGKDTQILMYDGSIKLVQDIVVGDILMGDNSTPRNVLTLARGIERMYMISSSNKLNRYIVNESHILSLKHKDNRVLDISVLDYLNKLTPSLKNNLYGYRVAIEFKKKHIEIDPYLLGKWLGSKTSREMLDLNPSLKLFCEKNGLIREIKNTFGKRTFIVNKFIPHCYKCNSRQIRLDLLKGMIDYKNEKKDQNEKTEFYKFSHHKREFVREIVYLCRSLGIPVVKQCIEQSKKNGFYKITDCIENFISNIFRDTYEDNDKNGANKIYKIYFNKSSIPSDGEIIYNCPSEKYKINIKKINIGDYYGFEIDGNHRFVLGDFSVTHNTVMALKIVSLMAKKTLIVVHKEFLLNQWIERITEFLPNAKVGRIQGPLFDSYGKDIVIGMIQTLYDREFHQGAFDDFGFTVVDEVHRIGSAQFSKTLIRLQSPNYLGITATLERKDGLTRGIHMFMGKLIYSETDRNTDIVNVRGIVYVAPPSETEFNDVVTDFRGNPMFSTMISKLCAFAPRTQFILQVLRDLIKENPEAQILVLGHNRCILVELYDEIEDTKFATAGYYLGGMKEAKLKESTEKQIILASYAMASEGFDHKNLSILVMITPKTDIIQSVGRILRQKHKNTVIVDIIDKHDIFQNQWNKRRIYYKKCGYNIRTIEHTKYLGMDNTNWKIIFEPNLKECEKNNEDDNTTIHKTSGCIFDPIID